MSGIKKANWNDENVAYLKANTSKGIIHLAEYFGVPQRSIKKKLTIMGIPLFYTKTEKEKATKPIKIDMNDGFDNTKHKIKNNSIVGKIPLWIPSDRMYAYLDPNKATQAHKDAVINKYANRHKPLESL